MVLDRCAVPGYTTVECDIAEAASIRIPEGRLELVVHAAGLAHVVPRGEADVARMFRINHTGTCNLLEKLEANRPARLVLISTVAVYGVEAGELLTEETALGAGDAYGLSKRRAEEAVEGWAAGSETRATILRLPLLYGENPPGNLRSMAEGIRRHRYFGIGSGTARRSMVGAEDVARVVPAAAEAGGVFHLTDGQHPQFRELERAFARRLGVACPAALPMAVAKVLARVGDAAAAVTGRRMPFDSNRLGKMTSTLTFSDERARGRLGWRPTPVLELIEAGRVLREG
jgi:nucleoside-diphosphate-sugar epimerase